MICSKCLKSHERNHRYCADCHAAYMREWRRSLSAEQKHKDSVRSYAGVYKRRGMIEQENCRICASDQSEMHHPDYAWPLAVEWLCRPCHLAEHRPS